MEKTPEKILVVEDSPTAMAIICEVLNKAGYASISAMNGEEGIKKAKEERPKLAVVDTLLPDIDGFEVCRKIKEALGVKNVKIIIITGAINAIDPLKAKQSGADDSCVKTKDMTVLVEIIKKILKGGGNMSKKILVIEDSPAATEIVTQLLTGKGHKVTSVATGNEGIAKAIADKPDVIIIDVVLPDMNGIEVCKNIRKTLDSNQTKIIMITGFIDAIDVVSAKKAGADDFCVKTEDMQNFKDAFEALI